MHRANKPVSSYCRAAARVCEYSRRDFIRLKMGRLGPCVTQDIAHCLLIVDPTKMSRQRLCTRTAENCERRRDYFERNKTDKVDNVGPCAPTLNVEKFPFADEGPPVQSPDTIPP